MTSGNRCSITLFTPGKPERLTPNDWDSHLGPLIPKPTAEDIRTLEARAREVTAAQAASSSGPQDADAKLWKKIPLCSIVDTSEQHIMKPKTLLDCCQCAKEFIHEYDLSDGLDARINLMRVLNHGGMILEQLGEMRCLKGQKSRCLSSRTSESASFRCATWLKKQDWSLLSAALSLKHVTDMKSFVTEEGAMDKAGRQLGLTPDDAKKCVQQAPSGRFGRFTLYVKGLSSHLNSSFLISVLWCRWHRPKVVSQESHAQLTTKILCS